MENEDCKSRLVYHRIEKRDLLMELTQHLTKAVLTKLNGASKKDCEILNHMVTHFLVVMSNKVEREQGESDSIHVEDLEESNDKPDKLIELIDKWQQKVIGHQRFGGTELKKFEDELRVRF